MSLTSLGYSSFLNSIQLPKKVKLWQQIFNAENISHALSHLQKLQVKATNEDLSFYFPQHFQLIFGAVHKKTKQNPQLMLLSCRYQNK